MRIPASIPTLIFQFIFRVHAGPVQQSNREIALRSRVLALYTMMNHHTEDGDLS